MSIFGSLEDRMADEQFHIVREPLTFSLSKVEAKALPGKTKEGSFLVFGAPGISVSGFVSASGVHMQCLTDEFSGSSEEIAWRFDTCGLGSGDVETGYFRILSNQGEYRLPFEITVEKPQPSMGDKEIPDLLHFAALAKSNYREALRLFYDPGFGEMLKEMPEEKTALDLYRGLGKNQGNEANFEEFLIKTGKKTANEYIPDVTQIGNVLPVYHAETGTTVEYYFRISRNGWGYTDIGVETEGDFLIPQTLHVDGSSFDPSNSAVIRYSVDRMRLHYGWNYGSIHLFGPWCDLTIPVRIKETPDNLDPKRVHRREMDSLLLKMMQNYEAFRARKIRGREWLQQMGNVIDRMLSMEPGNPAVLLYKVHLLISSGKQKEAAWALQDFDRRVEKALDIPTYSDPGLRGLRREDPELYAYRMYLGVLCEEDESRTTVYDAAQCVEEEHRKAPGDFRIAWILLYLSDEMQRRPSLRWELLKEEYDYGCRSPILYIEAMDMIRVNPSIISELDDFALQTLSYASRKDLLNDAIMAEVTALAKRRKTYSVLLVRILKRAYESGVLKKETLESIVSLNLRGNRTGKDAFEWYRKGVEAELSLTRLFEYFMMSIPEDYTGEIPEIILRYFSFQCELPWKRTAQLYSYIMHHRQENAEVYRQVMPAIRDFALSELTKEHATKDLCYLYWHILNNDVLTPENAAAAVHVMFSVKIKTPDPAYVSAILLYEEGVGEILLPLSDGEITTPVYGENFTVFFEDKYGNRVLADQKGAIERLSRYEDKVSMLSAFSTGIAEFDRFLSELPGDQFRISGFNVDRFLALSMEPSLREESRSEIRMKLLRYYEENERFPELKEFLDSLSPESFSSEQRGEILDLMLTCGEEKKAFDWAKTCGTSGIEDTTLLKMSSLLIDEEGGPLPVLVMEETDLSAFAEITNEAFLAGKYEDRTLLFLAKYFGGLSEELNEIRKTLHAGGIESEDLLHRLSSQLLYSGVTLPDEEELLSALKKNGAEDDIITALLAQLCHYYFVDDAPLGTKTLERIGDYAEKGRPLFDVTRMAYLKALSMRSGEYRESELETAKMFLSDLVAEGIVFPFFRRFSGLLPEIQEYADETLIEFRGKARANVKLHYTVDRDEKTTGSSEQEILMKEMYEGIYVTGFVLFFGEQVRYFITDDEEGRNVVESGTFGQDTRIAGEGEDRFSMINRISALTAMQKYPEALFEMEKYNRKASLVAKLFRRQ